jgi:hypothetical protein
VVEKGYSGGNLDVNDFTIEIGCKKNGQSIEWVKEGVPCGYYLSDGQQPSGAWDGRASTPLPHASFKERRPAIVTALLTGVSSARGSQVLQMACL